jgi:transcriptional regulator with XRE-family HTH domain
MEDTQFVDYVQLGERIREKRINTGLSQNVISEKVGLSESFYGHIERGDRKLSVESLAKIADYLDLSLDFLLLESNRSGNNKWLQSELDNLFRGKSHTQVDYLLGILKVLSANIDTLQK